MKKLIIFTIIIELILGAVAFLFYYANKPIKDTWYHSTDVSETQKSFEDIPIQSCDCYWYVKEYSLGGFAYSVAISGKLTVTDEYYNKIITQYNDFEKPNDIYLLEADYLRNIEDYSCSILSEFTVSGDYIMSELFNEYMSMLILISKDSHDLYIYQYSSR